MKKTVAAVCLFLLTGAAVGQNNRLQPYAEELILDEYKRVSYIRFKESHRVNDNEVTELIASLLVTDPGQSLSLQKTERDQIGFTHLRYAVQMNGISVANKMIVAHCHNGKLVSVNGDLYNNPKPVNTFLLTEKSALGAALKKVGAKKYKWENVAEEKHMREALGDPAFSYYPHGEKTFFEKDGKIYAAYQFNIYAEEPLYRANVYVNAANGQILAEHNLICTADVPATALTKYSGTQTITCDQTSSAFRLRETGRGLGIETYNMNNTTTYSSTDFTNATTSWTTTGWDQGATDAHWGAEKTYDYYMQEHNRNSINNAGFKLISYVHYSNNYSNAFWDGQRMTYGDGNGSQTIKMFATIDVCGHEITHGLTSNSSNLLYQNESGALNESYSDIFGACIEHFARPSNWNWKMGEDMMNSGAGLRNMANPSSFGDPDTYGGANWYTGTADNGGVHTNSGVSNFWFYLLTSGGSGVNDLANTYTVSGIGFTNAAKIAFRALTVYFTPSTNYAMARNLTIQAATDLFGQCSNEVIQTINAWHAVGVGAKFTPGVITPNFVATLNSFCTLPASVTFSNTTANGLSYSWDFGNGATATSTNAVHTYTANGTYNVKLKATGCGNIVDSVTKNSFIVINVPSNPVTTGAIGCSNAPVTLTATGSGTLKWFSAPSNTIPLGTGNNFAVSLPSTNTFYVSNTIPNLPAFGGIPNSTSSGGGYLNNNSQWLIFNVIQTSTLNTVEIDAQTAGVRIIQLRNSIGATLNSVTVSLAPGINTVTLNFPLNVGNNYRLALGNGSLPLYRTNTGVVYPYNIGGCVSITGSSAGAGLYYWFYNWQVTKEDCSSPLIPVAITINNPPLVTMAASSTLVCPGDEVHLTGNPGGGSFVGPGVNTTTFNGYNIGAGNYTVQYFYNDGAGCTGTGSTFIQVQECTGLDETYSGMITVYPNPAHEMLMIKGHTPGNTLAVTDASGRSIMMVTLESDMEQLNITNLANGIYFIEMRDAAGVPVKNIKMIKE